MVGVTIWDDPNGVDVRDGLFFSLSSAEVLFEFSSDFLSEAPAKRKRKTLLIKKIKIEKGVS